LEPPVDAWQPDPAAWHVNPFASPPHPKFRDRRWLHAVLFVLTILTTTGVGAGYYASFVYGVTNEVPHMPLAAILLRGFWYSATALTILTCHELGHYLACRYYNIDASLPFFLPVPLSFGTLGAFIRIREPIPTKRMFFDIGIAGPIAGFLVTVPALFAGLAMSTIVKLPDPSQPMIVYGYSLLLKLATRVLFGVVPAGYDLNAHPIVFGAWFGMLATALNLLPFGQLDGGHVAYCVLGRKSSIVSLVTVAVTAALSFFAVSWLVWTGLLLLMMRLVGRHHPRVYDEEVPLDRGRLALAIFAVVMLALCFTPVPISFTNP